MGDFEESLQKSIMSGTSEKSYLDKLFSKEDVDRVRNLIKKPKLNRSELKELFSMLSSNEAKKWNYGADDRYIMAKYFVWIREFVAIAEGMYDYEENLDQKKVKISKQSKKIFEDNVALMEHSIMFMVDLYFNLARTTLSLGGTGFLEALKNKYEMQYSQESRQSILQQEAKGGPKVKVAW